MATFTAPDGARIAYERYGDATGKTVVFLHGWHARGSVWHEHLLAFSEAYRCIAPDLRGFGASRDCPGPFTVAKGSDDVAALLDALAVERAVIVGHSMGGTIAQRFAADRPERTRGLVLVAPVPASGLPLAEKAQAFFRATPGDPDATAAFVDALAFGGRFEPTVAAALREFARAESAEAARAWFESWAFVDFVAAARTIVVPTLVVAPSHDRPLTPAFLQERVADLIAGSRLVVIPETGHYPQLERPDVVIAEIARFLADLG